MSSKPYIAITMGDPSGIGPEVILKAFASGNLYGEFTPVVIGDRSVMNFYLSLHSMKDVHLKSAPTWEEACALASNANSCELVVWDLANVNMENFRPGVISAMAGKASYEYILAAIDRAKAGDAVANVTAPICKASLNQAGYHFPGHTEIYAQMTGTERYLMTLFTDTIKVAHLTCHIAMKDVFDHIRKDNIIWACSLIHEALLRMGIEKPSIGVCALNPHASENGLFGNEESDEIIPAVVALREMGMDVSGPHPANTIFAKARYGKFDMVLAMYHDQGHVAVKTLYYEKTGNDYSFSGVNITLGLPIIRTSVDHGTAFDIARKNLASPKSLLDAYELACKLAGGNTSR